MKLATVALIIALTAVCAVGQTEPTLRIVTESPNLPSELFYGNIKVKPVRLRPGTNTVITINDSDFFVHQHYVDFLSRMPDQQGFNFWVSEIAGCGANPTCVEFRRINTSGAFFLSIEFRGTGYFVYRLNKASFGEFPKYQAFMPDTREVAKDIVVGQGNWQDQLEMNQVAFANAWVTRPEFVAEYGTKTGSDFVDAILLKAGLTQSDIPYQTIVNALNASNNSAQGRATALRAIIDSPAFDQKEKNPAFVLMQYFGYLRRDPDAAPDNDLTGFEFWLNKLNQFGGDFHAAEMVKAFIVSGEYNARF